MNWEKYRNQDNSINLVGAWLDTIRLKDKKKAHQLFEKEVRFLEAVQRYQPIRSRQVAALALAMADFLE